MRIYTARHGETNYNVQGLCNDDPARDVHLTEKGVDQARQLARRLDNVRLDCIYISELPRTRQTADVINLHHHVPVYIDARLNDIKSGFESRSVAEYFAATGSDRLNIVPAGGESLKQYQARVNLFIDDLVIRKHQQVLVIAHEETMRVFAARFSDVTDEQMESLHFDNCEYVVYQA